MQPEPYSDSLICLLIVQVSSLIGSNAPAEASEEE